MTEYLANIPNMKNLRIEHCIDPAPAGCKTVWIDIADIDYEDEHGVPISWKRVRTFDEACEWYANQFPHYNEEIIPYLVRKTIKVGLDKKRKEKATKKKKKSRFSIKFGKYVIKFP